MKHVLICREVPGREGELVCKEEVGGGVITTMAESTIPEAGDTGAKITVETSPTRTRIFTGKN